MQLLYILKYLPEVFENFCILGGCYYYVVWSLLLQVIQLLWPLYKQGSCLSWTDILAIYFFFFYSNNLGRPFQKKKSDFKKSFLYQNIHIHIWQGLLCKAVLPLWFLRRTWNLEVRTDPLLPVAEAVSCWNMIIAHEEQNHCWSLTPVLSSVNVVKPLRSKRWPANIPKSTQTYSSHTQMN